MAEDNGFDHLERVRVAAELRRAAERDFQAALAAAWNGPDGASLSEIGRAAGMSKSGVYRIVQKVEGAK